MPKCIGPDGRMRGARRELGIVRGERARIRARNGVICEAACEAVCTVWDCGAEGRALI